jgi:nucleotide-binding universal stress UspA family protein
MKFRKILIATDFSDASIAAINIAQPGNDSELILLHVNSISSAYLFGAQEIGTPVIIEEQSKITEEYAKDKILSFKNEYFKDQNIRTEVITSLKNVADEICNFAEKENCDLIVLGSRGHTALGAFFVGSVAQRVQLLTPCPLLVVPPNKK